MIILLKDIEACIKKNFTMSASGHHFLETSETVNGTVYPNMGIITFVGVAFFSGFSHKETLEYLAITKTKHKVYLQNFVAAYNECNSLSVSSLFDEANNYKRIMTKYLLVTNALKIEKPTDNFLTLADFGF